MDEAPLLCTGNSNRVESLRNKDILTFAKRSSDKFYDKLRIYLYNKCLPLPVFPHPNTIVRRKGQKNEKNRVGLMEQGDNYERESEDIDYRVKRFKMNLIGDPEEKDPG